jgi:hypothetical protein
LDENQDKTEKERIVKHVLYHLETVKRSAAESNEGMLVDEVMLILKRSIINHYFEMD